jgi:hypothetical protein
MHDRGLSQFTTKLSGFAKLGKPTCWMLQPTAKEGEVAW